MGTIIFTVGVTAVKALQIPAALSFPMHVFVCAVGLQVGEAATTEGKGWGGEGLVWPGLDGEGQPWMSCLSGFCATWVLLWTCMGSLSLALRQGIVLGVRRAGELLEALCRDKSLLASVAVLPPGSNKVQQSPCTSTKQKMENGGKTGPVLGSAHLPPQQDL